VFVTIVACGDGLIRPRITVTSGCCVARCRWGDPITRHSTARRDLRPGQSHRHHWQHSIWRTSAGSIGNYSRHPRHGWCLTWTDLSLAGGCRTRGCGPGNDMPMPGPPSQFLDKWTFWNFSQKCFVPVTRSSPCWPPVRTLDCGRLVDLYETLLDRGPPPREMACRPKALTTACTAERNRKAA
jgi:hypothetical protein